MIDVSEFEKQWRILSAKICQTIYIKPEIQELKKVLQSKGFLSVEEKSQFIDICDRIKYEVIQKQYGNEGTGSYKEFSEQWKEWFQNKGVESEHSKGQKDSVEHIMFGSTPDPARFLMNFEQEILGSLVDKD
ncbi:MAG: hypothetical protein COT92_02495 [Candidatus Doudnabacteria bacterium CG10_big_fil_rev_8_21_14_0_10_42_18]|uniref:Uncharacterized protein n=1 Tax=Candidatus Doudnabacteria bacterium CG10_big_fil_rev_8_21_14_0_10_42_18 TaxID=1974552 RepID=A0A2H0VAS2_9BACT|nr:MAG: hypothetical protein COT92_02495 [Candidatus Doudnabacteria bacterium CG10_big_fil_rev_8_21_14_0_10_42_18]